MFSITTTQLKMAAPHADNETINAIMAHSDLFAKYDITTRNRGLGFLSTAYEETGGFTALTENLFYTAERLVQVWPSRFLTITSAQPYARNQRALANKVYGGRMGNIGPDDGWKYRGRGLLQITGRDNYTKLQNLTGIPLIEHPELVNDPDYMLKCSLALFVQYHGILPACDRSDWHSVWALVGSGRADGSVIGLENHKAALEKLSAVIPVDALVIAVAPPPVESLWSRLLKWL
jgi:putative chitinase